MVIAMNKILEIIKTKDILKGEKGVVSRSIEEANIKGLGTQKERLLEREIDELELELITELERRNKDRSLERVLVGVIYGCIIIGIITALVQGA